MAWLPTASAVVEKVAWPLLSTVPLPIVAAPSRKLTVPLGVPAPGADALTVPVNVTFWPNTELAVDAVSEVAVSSLLTAWLIVVELATKFVLPP